MQRGAPPAPPPPLSPCQINTKSKHQNPAPAEKGGLFTIGLAEEDQEEEEKQEKEEEERV